MGISNFSDEKIVSPEVANAVLVGGIAVVVGVSGADWQAERTKINTKPTDFEKLV